MRSYLHRVDHLVHEPLRRDVGELQARQVRQHVVPDRVHQMRLAEAHAAVDEQRVVGARRRFGHRAAGRVRELVRRSDDERVEGVAGGKGPRRAGDDVLRRSGSSRRSDSQPATLVRAASAFLGHERHDAALSIDFGQRFVEHDRVVLVQPVAEERVRDPDAQQMAVVGDERRRLEPGREDVLVDFGFDAGKDLVPDAAGHVRACACHCETPAGRPSETLSPLGHPVVTGCLRDRQPLEPRKQAFPAAFAPWKPASLRDREAGAGRKPWLFHIFFHSCGKLRGETLRVPQGRRL